MSTRERYQQSELVKANSKFSRVRVTIESAFYGNNVHEVKSVAEAYELAKRQPGVIETDLPILHTSDLVCRSGPSNWFTTTARFWAGRHQPGTLSMIQRKTRLL